MAQLVKVVKHFDDGTEVVVNFVPNPNAEAIEKAVADSKEARFEVEPVAETVVESVEEVVAEEEEEVEGEEKPKRGRPKKVDAE